MESFFNSDAVRILKERTIKIEELLRYNATLEKEYKDLEEAHKKSTSKYNDVCKNLKLYLVGYCKLDKIKKDQQQKILELEKTIKEQIKNLEESRLENEKQVALVHIYQTEREIYNPDAFDSLKKDKNYLLDACWKMMKWSQAVKRSDTNTRTRKLMVTFFEKYKKELEDLKLGDLRNNIRQKLCEVGGWNSGEEMESPLLSPELQSVGSVESGFYEISSMTKSFRRKSLDPYVSGRDSGLDVRSEHDNNTAYSNPSPGSSVSYCDDNSSCNFDQKCDNITAVNDNVQSNSIFTNTFDDLGARVMDLEFKLSDSVKANTITALTTGSFTDMTSPEEIDQKNEIFVKKRKRQLSCSEKYEDKANACDYDRSYKKVISEELLQDNMPVLEYLSTAEQSFEASVMPVKTVYKYPNPSKPKRLQDKKCSLFNREKELPVSEINCCEKANETLPLEVPRYEDAGGLSYSLITDARVPCFKSPPELWSAEEKHMEMKIGEGAASLLFEDDVQFLNEQKSGRVEAEKLQSQNGIVTHDEQVKHIKISSEKRPNSAAPPEIQTGQFLRAFDSHNTIRSIQSQNVSDEGINVNHESRVTCSNASLRECPDEKETREIEVGKSQLFENGKEFQVFNDNVLSENTSTDERLAKVHEEKLIMEGDLNIDHARQTELIEQSAVNIATQQVHSGECLTVEYPSPALLNSETQGETRHIDNLIRTPNAVTEANEHDLNSSVQTMPNILSSQVISENGDTSLMKPPGSPLTKTIENTSDSDVPEDEIFNILDDYCYLSKFPDFCPIPNSPIHKSKTVSFCEEIGKKNKKRTTSNSRKSTENPELSKIPTQLAILSPDATIDDGEPPVGEKSETSHSLETLMEVSKLGEGHKIEELTPPKKRKTRQSVDDFLRCHYGVPEKYLKSIGELLLQIVRLTMLDKFEGGKSHGKYLDVLSKKQKKLLRDSRARRKMKSALWKVENFSGVGKENSQCDSPAEVTRENPSVVNYALRNRRRSSSCSSAYDKDDKEFPVIQFAGDDLPYEEEIQRFITAAGGCEHSPREIDICDVTEFISEERTEPALRRRFRRTSNRLRLTSETSLEPEEESPLASKRSLSVRSSPEPSEENCDVQIPVDNVQVNEWVEENPDVTLSPASPEAIETSQDDCEMPQPQVQRSGRRDLKSAKMKLSPVFKKLKTVLKMRRVQRAAKKDKPSGIRDKSPVASTSQSKPLEVITNEAISPDRCSEIGDESSTARISQPNPGVPVHFKATNLRERLARKCKSNDSPLTEKMRQKLFMDNLVGSDGEEEVSPTEPHLVEEQGDLMDSIMSAMSKQHEEYKAPKNRLTYVTYPNENASVGAYNHELGKKSWKICGYRKWEQRKRKNEHRPQDEPQETTQQLPEELRASCESQVVEPEPRTSELPRKLLPRRNQPTAEKIKREIENFLSSTMTSTEEAETMVKPCVALLEQSAEEVIASVIVPLVQENVDEVLEVNQTCRAPPLTKTQSRLLTLLALVRDRDSRFPKIAAKILKTIRWKLFPERFFWPDDSVEQSARFYAALGKLINNATSVWKLCVHALAEMRQRFSLVIFTVLQTWPDILHDASQIHDNLLPTTLVYLVLQTPKIEDERRLLQEKKLMALKHLLVHFYHFDGNKTIEVYTQKLMEAFFEEKTGAEESLILVARCRGWIWSGKHLVPKLMIAVTEWGAGKLSQIIGIQTLNIIRQFGTAFPCGDAAAKIHIDNIVANLANVLCSGQVDHTSEELIVEVILVFKQHIDVNPFLVKWFPKWPVSSALRQQITAATFQPKANPPAPKQKFLRGKRGYRKRKNTAGSDRTTAKNPKKKRKKRKGRTRSKKIVNQ